MSARLLVCFATFAAATSATVHAAASGKNPGLADRLNGIRSRVVELESGILDALKTTKAASANMRKIQRLIELQREERTLGKKRLGELEAKVLELETRRGMLAEKIKSHQREVRRALVALERSSGATATGPAATDRMRSLRLPEAEKIEAPRRRALAALADRGLKEVEVLRVDLADAETLENRIQEEKQQLAYLFQDLQEQESILELNRQLQVDLIRKKHEERLAQLENYRKLKDSQQHVESLIGQFNARLELERATEAERAASRAAALAASDAAAQGGPSNGSGALSASAFGRLKGRLGLPVADGRVVSAFGRNFDPKSRLYIFKKGVDISAAKNAEVRAISSGKIAYSGELPEYGRVAIVDHGDHFYSLCAHLGELRKKAGDSVTAGDAIGAADDSGTPVYFEIRARNVAVNPLQWVSNASILSR